MKKLAAVVVGVAGFFASQMLAGESTVLFHSQGDDFLTRRGATVREFSFAEGIKCINEFRSVTSAKLSKRNVRAAKIRSQALEKASYDTFSEDEDALEKVQAAHTIDTIETFAKMYASQLKDASSNLGVILQFPSVHKNYCNLKDIDKDRIDFFYKIANCLNKGDFFYQALICGFSTSIHENDAIVCDKYVLNILYKLIVPSNSDIPFTIIEAVEGTKTVIEKLKLNSDQLKYVQKHVMGVLKKHQSTSRGLMSSSSSPSYAEFLSDKYVNQIEEAFAELTGKADEVKKDANSNEETKIKNLPPAIKGKKSLTPNQQKELLAFFLPVTGTTLTQAAGWIDFRNIIERLPLSKEQKAWARRNPVKAAALLGLGGSVVLGGGTYVYYNHAPASISK